MIVSSLANATTYNKDTHDEFVKMFSQQVGGKKITLDLGNSNETSQIVIKNGACDDYVKLFYPVATAAKSPENTEGGRIMINRVAYALARQMKKMGCKL